MAACVGSLTDSGLSLSDIEDDLPAAAQEGASSLLALAASCKKALAADQGLFFSFERPAKPGCIYSATAIPPGRVLLPFDPACHSKLELTGDPIYLAVINLPRVFLVATQDDEARLRTMAEYAAPRWSGHRPRDIFNWNRLEERGYVGVWFSQQGQTLLPNGELLFLWNEDVTVVQHKLVADEP